MEKIREQEFQEAYKIMEEAFPISERRSYEKMLTLFKQKAFTFFGIHEQAELLGVIMCWECESCVFIENFAVSKKARGKGIGSVILTEVKEYYKNETIILEVETPFDEMSERRIGFYMRNGFILNVYGYVQPQINSEVNSIPLLIMSYPNRLQKECFEVVKKEIFSEVYDVKEAQ